ncbi:MAG: TrmH family RNA methyltransferase, partial [Candidatus Coproplasma sp.]
SDEVVARSDNTVKIPMRESCESLNAAISAAIAMYALKNNQRR